MKVMRLVADKNSASGESLRLVPRSEPVPPHRMDIGQAAYAVWMAELLLGSTPHQPAVAYLRETRQQTYDEAVENLRNLLHE